MHRNLLEIFPWNLLDIELQELHSELIFHAGWMPVGVSIIFIHLIVTWQFIR